MCLALSLPCLSAQDVLFLFYFYNHGPHNLVTFRIGFGLFLLLFEYLICSSFFMALNFIHSVNLYSLPMMHVCNGGIIIIIFYFLVFIYLI